MTPQQLMKRRRRKIRALIQGKVLVNRQEWEALLALKNELSKYTEGLKRL